MTDKIAFGGGCHWCTEAVFQSLMGVESVEQGFVASTNEHSSFSEAVIVHFNSKCITLKTLIEIHLLTHNSRSDHSMRQRYRSAVYVFDRKQMAAAQRILNTLQNASDDQLITRLLRFDSFKSSREEIVNYYFKDPEKPFCTTYIAPKLKMLLHQFSKVVDPEKMEHLQSKNEL